MLRQGPLPAAVHGLVEYAAAVLFIVAPFVFAFDDNVAVAACIVTGLLILAVTATSQLPTGLVKGIPPTVHLTIDLVVAALLVAAAFLLGFREEGGATALFITMGVLHLLLTIATRFTPADEHVES